MYVPLPFSIFGSFYPNVRLFFLCQNFGWRYRRGRKKKPTILVFLFVFFCWAQFFASPSEWRPRRPPIPPVGKTAPDYTTFTLAWMPDELSPAHKILGREVRSGITPLGRNYFRTEIAGPIKLSRRALYDDGQMINSNVIKHVTNTRVECVLTNHGCRCRAEMYRFESI